MLTGLAPLTSVLHNASRAQSRSNVHNLSVEGGPSTIASLAVTDWLGRYCCPYMKVCVATGSTSCGGTLGLCNNPRCGEWTTGFPDSCTSCQNYEWKNVVSCAAGQTSSPVPAPSGGGSCSDESFCSRYTSSFPQYCPYTMTYNGVAKPFSEYCPSSCNACP